MRPIVQSSASWGPPEGLRPGVTVGRVGPRSALPRAPAPPSTRHKPLPCTRYRARPGERRVAVFARAHASAAPIASAACLAAPTPASGRCRCALAMPTGRSLDARCVVARVRGDHRTVAGIVALTGRPFRRGRIACSRRTRLPRRNRRAPKLPQCCPKVAPGAEIRPDSTKTARFHQSSADLGQH